MSRLESDSTHDADAVRRRLDQARGQLRGVDEGGGAERDFASSPAFADAEVGFASQAVPLGGPGGKPAAVRDFASGGAFEPQ